MTEIMLRQSVVETAKSFLGRKEADGSHKEIIDIYNSIQPLPNGYRMKYTDPWCAAFVSAVAWLCRLISIIFPSASCPDMVNRYKAAGRWMERDDYMPQLGDVVFYDWDDGGKGDNAGTPDHVGLVVDVYASSYNVIEGNASDMVKIRTMQRNGRYLRGFGLPDYAAAARDAGSDEVIVVPEPQLPVLNPDTPAGDVFSLRFRILRTGCKGEDVRALQRNLKSMGFDVGRYGLDGEFGADTRAALVAYQRSVRLDPDGEAGPLTMSALNGLRKE